MSTNGYRGWKLNPRTPKIEEVICNKEGKNMTESDKFYQDYVCARKPVVLRGYAKSLTLYAKIRDLDYLKEKSKDSFVSVEKRASACESFGKGQRSLERMRFSDFLSCIEKGEELIYLTAQQLEEDEPNDERFPLIYPPLENFGADLSELSGNGRLCDNLLLQSVNIWIGNSKEKSSSGLHHDFHDNIYLLLSGSKTFNLFSPADAFKIPMHGEVETVYSNGRICYKDQSRDIGEDGAPKRAAEEEEIEIELEKAEEAVNNGELNAEKRLRDAEKKMDSFLDSLVGEDSNEFETSSDPEEVSEYPDNFSRVNSIDAEKLFRSSRAVVTLHEGDALYLPASWFHEVESFSKSGTEPHIAINLWYHPPDNYRELNPTSPYITQFWKRRTSDSIPKRIEEMRKYKSDLKRKRVTDEDENSPKTQSKRQVSN